MRELDIHSFHGMQYVNTTQISWFSWTCYSFEFIFSFIILKKKKINLTLRRLQMYGESTKLKFDISKCICFFTLI